VHGPRTIRFAFYNSIACVDLELCRLDATDMPGEGSHGLGRPGGKCIEVKERVLERPDGLLDDGLAPGARASCHVLFVYDPDTHFVIPRHVRPVDIGEESDPLLYYQLPNGILIPGAGQMVGIFFRLALDEDNGGSGQRAELDGQGRGVFILPLPPAIPQVLGAVGGREEDRNAPLDDPEIVIVLTIILYLLKLYGAYVFE